jgi:LL-diaminopimelate aminotransferase
MYRERRNVLCSGLRSIGWHVDDTPATMFTWAPIPKKFSNSVDFVYQLLDKANVICVPGSNFGPRGEGFVRIAMVEPPEILNRFVEKIKNSGLL